MVDPANRSAVRAFLGTVIIPGLGHWYVGRYTPAIWCVLVVAVGFPAAITALVAADVDARLVVWPTVIGAYLVLVGFASHAAWEARRQSHDFRPTRAHRLGAYVAFIVLSASLRYLPASLVKSHVVEAVKTPSESGRPNLHAGDHFVVTKLDARDRAAKRGDIVLFPYPDDPAALFVKRVVARGGETIGFSDGIPVVDGAAFQQLPCDGGEPRCKVEVTPEGVRYEVLEHELREGVEPVEVPSGYVYVLGDNRGVSHDSSAFGPIPVDSVKGRARAVWLPLNRAHSLDPD